MTAAGRASAQAATAGAAGGSVPRPSVSDTSGCNDVEGGNVRVNQECTNQSDAAFLGRGQGQNETTIAVNPKNPRHLVAGQNDYRRGETPSRSAASTSPCAAATATTCG